MNKISFIFYFTDKSSFGVSFLPEAAEAAKEQLKATIDYQNSLLDNEKISQHLTRKSNIRAKRKCEFQIIFNGKRVRTNVKGELKTSAFTDPSFLDTLFPATVRAAQNIIHSQALGVELTNLNILTSTPAIEVLNIG